jgi:DNA-binding CsgD family transcriptional regulator
MEISAVIGDIYDAGASGDWPAVGGTLLQFLDADVVSLRLKRPGCSSVNIFEPMASGEPELCPDSAKPGGQRHMLLGLVDGREGKVIGFFRERPRFEATAKSALGTLLPHMRRVLLMRQRLRGVELNARVGHSVLEALPGCAVIVDARLNVLSANSAAERMFSARGMPIAITASAPARDEGLRRLVVNNRDKAARLRTLVDSAARGGSGGAMKLEVDNGADDRIDRLAVTVSSQPPQSWSQDDGPSWARPVLILITELSRSSAPKSTLFSDLFGLSIAEGAVALALLGGQTAETVARERDVSLDTVRSQIRTVLRKSEAINLRDFERIGALLTTLCH